MKGRRKMLVADLLCGAGGSSTGCVQALRELGLDVELVCVNHWPIAIETHKRNHPEARHYVQDIATVRPHLIVPEGYLDLLMASPTCTHHSVARGGKPTSDQQRSDPWHIITWLTELRVRRLIIENVWEWRKWGPVDPATCKPIKEHEGEYFDAFVATLRRLRFEPEWRKLNAADFGEATTRQRFIMMARSDGRRVLWPVPTHARQVADQVAPGLKPWRPAREIIDWSIKGRSIFGRRKLLAPKTLARILAGALKFKWPEPFPAMLVAEIERSLLFHIGWAFAARNRPHKAEARRKRRAFVRDLIARLRHLRIEPAAVAGAVRRAEPMLVTLRRNANGSSVRNPIPTVSAGTHTGLALPVVATAEPFVLSRQGGGAPRSIEAPTPTQCAKHSQILIAPYYSRGSGETCGSDGDPLPTMTAKARFGMVVPVTHADGSNRARDTDAEPLPTLTTASRGEQALVEATPQFDILFRMLEPHELAAAMGFTSAEARYEFVGTKTDQIKQIGNAVSVAKMRACVKAIMADAARADAPAAEVETRAA